MKCLVYLSLWLYVYVLVTGHPSRSKRTLGFIFRGLVDAATREGERRVQSTSSTTTTTTSTTTPISITSAAPEPRPARNRAPKPMIYIIPVSHKSPHAPDVNSLTEVLKDVRVPVKIKVETNGSTDPDLKALLQATKLLTVDKRNVSFKESQVEVLNENPDQIIAEAKGRPETKERLDTKERSETKERHVTIKIQMPTEENEHQFTVRVIGDDVKVRKTKNGYIISLTDAKADIRLDFPREKSAKQSQTPSSTTQRPPDQIYQPYPDSYFHHPFADAFRSSVDPYQPSAPGQPYAPGPPPPTGLGLQQGFHQNYQQQFQVPNFQQPTYDQTQFGSERLDCLQAPYAANRGFTNCTQNANNNNLGI